MPYDQNDLPVSCNICNNLLCFLVKQGDKEIMHCSCPYEDLCNLDVSVDLPKSERPKYERDEEGY